MESPKEKNPVKFIWNLFSFPLAVLGLLGLSDSLISFHTNIQLLIDSYHSIVYPIFYFIFGWLWFDMPEVVFDYLFLGFLFASNERKVWGFIRVSENILINIFLHICAFLMSVIFWPFIALEMAWQIKRTNSNGLITSLAKQPKPFYVKYNLRDQDILVFRYIGAVMLVFIIFLIINYTYLGMT